MMLLSMHSRACVNAETPIFATGRFDFACRRCEAMPRTVVSFKHISGSACHISISFAVEACATDALNKRALSTESSPMIEPSLGRAASSTAMLIVIVR